MRYVLFVSSIFCVAVASASATPKVAQPSNPFRYPFYVGAAGGFGSTTWEGLVPSNENQSVALNLSTPTWVNEGGSIWGFFAGYELTPYFAVEANYTHYPKATVLFDDDSLFVYGNEDGHAELKTNTQAYSLMGRIMLIIPGTNIRAYSGAGAAYVQRSDEIIQNWRISPTFSAGVNYNFTERIMGELGANYTAGYGETELSPVDDFTPFLYSVFLKIAYRF